MITVDNILRAFNYSGFLVKRPKCRICQACRSSRTSPNIIHIDDAIFMRAGRGRGRSIERDMLDGAALMYVEMRVSYVTVSDKLGNVLIFIIFSTEIEMRRMAHNFTLVSVGDLG